MSHIVFSRVDKAHVKDLLKHNNFSSFSKRLLMWHMLLQIILQMKEANILC